ncbi:PREDICTED: autophagy-related protein 18f-like [Camelina sativa]|uniref:Autophagy-related protein 18f-like n=1 Tax=Camelina sativa TaxID=90675 RepID=A0ABM0XA10_CAMSA|nr:PREDICTED: autophagy-related protein 18f-like [Camelina sativa]
MRKNGDGSSPKSPDGGVVSRSARSSFRALSNCLRVISSGASTVARSAVSAASSAVRDVDSHHDQVLWAGFDKLEKEDGDARRVLLLAFQSGFQVWDVEDTENVHVIVSAHDGQASFMQMLPNPLNSGVLDDRFYESRPLLAVCGDSSWEDKSSKQISSEDPGSETVVIPTNVYVYSLKSQSYVQTLKFRSTVYSVRCSSRIVAVLQVAQIHCFDASTLEMDYTIVTNSIVCGSLGVGYGPLAVGPRWIAYSGSRIADSSSAIFTSELLSLSSSPSVAQFARESSKQLASGIVNLGDKGYKSLSRYCSEVLPNPYIPGLKSIGVVNENVPDADSIGMVIVKNITNKSVITQFKAHKSPISALCFDPSGMLLVSASIQGHNINVFRILPTVSTSRDGNTKTFAHLFRLQRGFTNAVIQDICFSNDSNLIVVSSSRGTSHLFEINSETEGESPVPLSAINRIRSKNSSGWIGTMSDAASAAAGMVGGSVPGAITSSFCYSDEKSNNNYYGSPVDFCSKTNLLVFAPSGCLTQYALREHSVGVGHENMAMTGFDFESGLETEGKLAVDPIRRWSMIQNQSRRETQDHHSDIYGGGTSVDSKSKVFPEVVRKQSVEESWKVTKKGTTRVEDQRHLFIFEAELQMHLQTQLPLWARRKFRFQELVLNRGGEISSGEGGGEMEIEGIQTRTIEARTRDLVPVWGYLQSPRSEQVVNESMQSQRNTTEGDKVTPLEGHGTETDLGAVHSEEEEMD